MKLSPQVTNKLIFKSGTMDCVHSDAAPQGGAADPVYQTGQKPTKKRPADVRGATMVASLSKLVNGRPPFLLANV